MKKTTHEARALAQELGLDPDQTERLASFVIGRARFHELLGMARAREAGSGPVDPDESLLRAAARYEELRQADPELTLRDFAEAEGLNYRSLVTRRQRIRARQS